MVAVGALRCPFCLCCAARFLQLIGTNEGPPKLPLVHRSTVVGVPDGRCHRRITPPQESRWLDTLWDGCCVWGLTRSLEGCTWLGSQERCSCYRACSWVRHS